MSEKRRASTEAMKKDEKEGLEKWRLMLVDIHARDERRGVSGGQKPRN